MGSVLGGQQVSGKFQACKCLWEPRLSEEALSDGESAGQEISVLETAALAQSPCAGEGHGKRGLTAPPATAWRTLPARLPDACSRPHTWKGQALRRESVVKVEGGVGAWALAICLYMKDHHGGGLGQEQWSNSHGWCYGRSCVLAKDT